MSESLPWQAVGDCSWCKVEGATVELIDPSHPSFHYGRAADSTCQLCGHRETYEGLTVGTCRACGDGLTEHAREHHACERCGDLPAVTRVNGIDLADAIQVRRALDAWAQREGMRTDELCQSSLGLDVDEVVQRLVTGQLVESTLHAIAFLFPGMAAGGSASESIVTEAPVVPAAVVPLQAIDPRAPVRLLISVMLADGAIVAGELSFIERFLTTHGLSAIQPEELRPWRPHEIGAIQDEAMALAALEAAVELMHLDGSRDGSELRIVRTFARVWGIPEAQIEKWNRTYERRYAPPLSIVWRALTRWVS